MGIKKLMGIKKSFHILALGILIGYGLSIFTFELVPWFLDLTWLRERRWWCVDFSWLPDKEKLEYDETDSSQRPDFLKEHEIPI